MKTRELLDSLSVEELLRATFKVNRIKFGKVIPGFTKWSSFIADEEYLAYGGSNHEYKVYSYSVGIGFQELDVVHTVKYYSGEEENYHSSTVTKFAKYYTLAKALVEQSSSAIFVVVICRHWGFRHNVNYATIYRVPDLNNYLKK